jgi:DNA-directed RNA polymerase specialized sigma subunit
MVKHPADYRWSSCADFLISRGKNRYGIQPDDVLDLLNKPKQQNYQQKMLDDLNMELPPVHRSVGYGECELTEVMNEHLSKESENLEFHQEVRFDQTPESIIQAVIQLTKVTSVQLMEHKKNNLPRELTCFALRTMTTLTLKEIGKHVNMSYFSVCNTNKKFKRKLESDKTYKNIWNKLKRGLSE